MDLLPFLNLQNRNVEDFGHGILCNLKELIACEYTHNLGEILRNGWLLTMDHKTFYYDLNCTKDVLAWYKGFNAFFIGVEIFYLSSCMADRLVNMQYLEREIPMITGDKK